MKLFFRSLLAALGSSALLLMALILSTAVAPAHAQPTTATTQCAKVQP